MSASQSDAEPRNQISRIIDRLRFCEDALRNGVPEEYFGWAGDQPSLGELAQSDASAGPQDVRAKHAVYRIENECFGWDKSFNSEQAYWIIRSALAQSDAEPVEEDKPLGFRTNDVPDPYAEGPQSDAEQEPDDNFERHLHARISKLEREIAELTLEQRTVFDAGIDARSDVANAALVQSDAEPQEIVEARERVRDCNSWHDCQQCSDDEKVISEYEAALARSNAEPDASAGLIEAADESAWVIEFSSPVCGTKSWYFLGDDPGEFMTPAAEKALRFARKQDAEQFITRQGWTDALAQELRSRAADRSEPDASAGLIEAVEQELRPRKRNRRQQASQRLKPHHLRAADRSK